ncbi:MAG: DUF1684 domain-containing protein [Spirosomaceae bacterium]|jgi:hypothetical protein|nr:DUF1684 domain-containing protein [Spirosomataceae bacterium]
MFKNKFFVGLIVAVIAGVIGYTFLGEDTRVSVDVYLQKIEQERKDKNSFFKNSEQSPLESKADFDALSYFAPNIAYQVTATVTAYDSTDKEVKVPMTDGSTATYQKYGYATFEMEDKPQRLLIYQHSDGLSILFRDATAPAETYGGGRYLDLKESDIKDGKLVIDFNNAYNPYCAYNHRYACPLPPKQNTLAVRIEAGEKKWE